MDLWERVQAIVQKRSKEYFEKHGNKKSENETVNIFKGLVMCGGCGTKMFRCKEVLPSGSLTYRFQCYVRKQNKDVSCKTAAIRERDLINIVHKIIFEEIQRTVDVKSVIEGLDRDSAKEKAGLLKQIEANNKRLAQMRVYRMSLVESLAIKRISESDFVYAKSKYESEETELRQVIETLETQMNDESLTVKNKWLSSFQRFMDEKIITREMAVTLIQKIVAYDNEHIDVFLNFRSDYEKITEYIGEVEAI
jgi:hypothetical protein